MSATNRGADIAPHEFYETPSWAVHLILDELSNNTMSIDAPKTDHSIDDWWWLDAGAGSGNIIKSAREWFRLRKRKAPKWTAVELDQAHEEALKTLVAHHPIHSQVGKRGGQCIMGDFLTIPLERRHSVAIYNPPFSQALEFIQAALTRANVVIMLQRLGWIEPRVKEDLRHRNEWLSQNMPDVYVIRRPAFIPGSGRTDAAVYAWFVWHRIYGRRMGRIKVLPLPAHDLEKRAKKKRRKRKDKLELVVTGKKEGDAT